MAPTARKPLREQAYEALRQEIQSSTGNERLPSIRELSRRLGSSFFTVKSAVAQLEAEGLVERRHGSGTYITGKFGPMRMSDAVVLCLHSYGHTWGEMCRQFVSDLQARHRIISMADRTDGNLKSTILRAARGGVRTFVTHVGLEFPAEVFRQCADVEDIDIIGVAAWESPLVFPRLYRVLIDYEVGGWLVAEHLHKLGHERVAMVHTHGRLQSYRRGELLGTDLPRAFVTAWESFGGRCDMVESTSPDADHCVVDAEALLDSLSGPEGATAIFGLRDTEANAAAKVIGERLGERADQIAVVGYFDTPWSQGATPAITSVNVNTAGIVAAAMEILDTLHAGQKPAHSQVMIPPRLVVRETSCRRED